MKGEIYRRVGKGIWDRAVEGTWTTGDEDIARALRIEMGIGKAGLAMNRIYAPKDIH